MDKLLLIDDEVDVQYSFKRIFDSPEIELTTATSGEEGLRLIPRIKPDLVIMSAHWIQYGRPQWFDSTIADIKQTILRLNETGVPVVLFGPSVQFRSRLPSMLMRAHLRHVDARPQDFVLPDIFLLDQKMKAALPAHEGFAYISVVDAVCPERQCPLTIEAGVPLAWDAMHLTAEGSVYVAVRLKTMIHFKK